MWTRLTFLINKDANILNIYILVNQVHNHGQKIVYHDHVGVSPGIQGWFTCVNQVNIIHHINGLKERNHVIVLIGTAKAFDKTQHFPVIKFMDRLRMERAHCNIIKATYEKTAVSIMLNGKEPQSIHTEIWKKMRRYLSLLLFSIMAEGLARTK